MNTYQVGQAFQPDNEPDNVRLESLIDNVRLESLTYSSLAGG